MSFSEGWDNLYKHGSHMSVWPWSDLVSYVMRYSRPKNSKFRVLELGCGAGANIPFFKSLNVQYYGIEGSHSVVKKLIRRFPELKSQITQGDFTKAIPFSDSFDLIVDRGSLTHNSTASIKNCLSMLQGRLRPEGVYIGIDWFSTKDSYFKYGKQDQDMFTRHSYKEDRFAGVGRVHFSTKAHIKELFDGYTINFLEHKITKQEIPSGGNTMASWNFIAKRVS